MAGKKDADDPDLFRAVMQDVKPLKRRTPRAAPPPGSLLLNRLRLKKLHAKEIADPASGGAASPPPPARPKSILYRPWRHRRARSPHRPAVQTRPTAGRSAPRSARVDPGRSASRARWVFVAPIYGGKALRHRGHRQGCGQGRRRRAPRRGAALAE